MSGIGRGDGDADAVIEAKGAIKRTASIAEGTARIIVRGIGNILKGVLDVSSYLGEI